MIHVLNRSLWKAIAMVLIVLIGCVPIVNADEQASNISNVSPDKQVNVSETTISENIPKPTNPLGQLVDDPILALKLYRQNLTPQ